jgi:hypothetical protein
MKGKATLLPAFVLLALSLSCLPLAKATVVCNSTLVNKPVDFLFLIDGSPSMCTYISAITAGFESFTQKLVSSNVDYQFGIVVFGGSPQLLSPLTTNGTAIKSILGAIQCTYGAQEASFEAIRMVLGSTANTDLVASCSKGVTCQLNWRSNSSKVLMIATNEDSDLPTNRYDLASMRSLCSFNFAHSIGRDVVPFVASINMVLKPITLCTALVTTLKEVISMEASWDILRLNPVSLPAFSTKPLSATATPTIISISETRRN